MRWYAYRNLIRRSVELLLIDDRSGRRAFGLPVTVTMKVENEEDIGVEKSPTLSLPLEAAESLMQELWNQGFRPNTDEGTPATVMAMQKHIAFAEHVATQLLSKSTR